MTAAPPEKYAFATIPALNAIAPGLGDIPGCDPSAPNFKDPDAPWRKDWFAKRERLARVRAQIKAAAAKDPVFQARQKELCRRDWAYFAAVFGWTYDPRARDGEELNKPFLPFAIQVNKIQEIQRVCGEVAKSDIFDTKSRGIGWTDTYCKAATAAWLTTDYALHFVSYKEDKVYRRNDRSTIFGKIEYGIQRLPDWWLPANFDIDAHMLRLNLFNPETGASITGESTTSRTARGDRYTAIIYDECAFIENFKDVYGVGAGTTNHRFCLSTESWEQGTDWETLWQDELNVEKGGKPERVWVVDWWHNPYQDAKWYEEEKIRWKSDPHGFAREYERDPAQAATTLVYPEVRHCARTEEHHDPTKTLIVGIDPGHAQPTGISWGQLITKDGRKGIRWLGSYQRAKVPTSFFVHLLTGIPPQPQDECWAMWEAGMFSERDKRLMAWFAERRAAAGQHSEFTRFCMDPAGKQEHAGTSFHGQFVAKSQELLVREWEAGGSKGNRPRGISPNYKYLQEQGNLILDRVLCTRLYLGATEFSVADPEFWRAEDLRDALWRSKYAETTERTTSQPKIVHGEESHLRTSAEYASVYLYLGMIDPPKRIARQMLDSLQGKAA